jgi:serine/threonine-protein kinase RsbW
MSQPTRAASTRLRFDIPSDFMRGREVQEKILEAVAQHGYVEDAVFAIKLALDEAMINAIKHGNKLDPGKRVKVSAEVGPDLADITIIDQGPGFVREDVPDPTLEENLEKTGGRGLLLIEAYMTSADWTDSGRHLRMTRRNAAMARA